MPRGLMLPNAADFCPNVEAMAPGNSELGGSDMIVTEVRQVVVQSKPALGVRSNLGRCGHHNGPNANGPNSLSRGAGAGPVCTLARPLPLEWWLLPNTAARAAKPASIVLLMRNFGLHHEQVGKIFDDISDTI